MTTEPFPHSSCTSPGVTTGWPRTYHRHLSHISASAPSGHPTPSATPGWSTSELAVLAQQFDAVDDPDAVLQLVVARAHRLEPAGGLAILQCHGRANWSTAAAVDTASQDYADLHVAFNREFSIAAPRRGNVGQSASTQLELQRVRPEAQLARHGIRYILIAPLGTPRTVFGTFNWYLHNAPADDLVESARCFARHASLAYLHARERRDLMRAVAVHGRIGQAQGILMAWLEIDSDAAFTAMQRRARCTDTTLGAVARQVISGSTVTVAPPGTTPVPRPSGAPEPTELDRAVTWLRSTTTLTADAQIDALQDVILVLATELDEHADKLRVDVEPNPCVADGLSLAADVVRDVALAVRATDVDA